MAAVPQPPPGGGAGAGDPVATAAGRVTRSHGEAVVAPQHEAAVTFRLP